MTLSIRHNLKTLEAAGDYNRSVGELQAKWGGCISARACTSCYHVISDSICLCVGVFTCPNCGYKNDIIKISSEPEYYI